MHFLKWHQPKEVTRDPQVKTKHNRNFHFLYEILPNSAGGMVSGSSKVKGRDPEFDFDTEGSGCSSSPSPLFCFPLFLLLLLAGDCLFLPESQKKI